METKDRDIKELKPTQSFNTGTKKGDRVLLRSLKELGCCRSIVVDRNDNVLIGNRVLQKAIDAGVTKVRVVETMGRELVVVKRMDIDLNTRKAEEIRLTDNLTAELGLRWDVPKILQTMNTIWGFNPRDWKGMAIVMKGTHMCKTMRGVKNNGKMTVCHLSGVFREDAQARNEFYKLIDQQKE